MIEHTRVALNSGFCARIGVAGALLVGASPVLAQEASGNANLLLMVGALVAVLVPVIGFAVLRLLRHRLKQSADVSSAVADSPAVKQPAADRAPVTAAAEPRSPPPQVQMPDAYLEDISGFSRRLRNRLSFPTMYIGRTPRGDGVTSGDIILERPSIGREHAVIEYRDNAFYMRDQGSRNGTYLNGSKLVGDVLLRNQDNIAFHNIEFRFEIHDASAKEASAHAHMGTMMAEPGEWQAYVQAGGAQQGDSAAAPSRPAGDAAAAASDPVEQPPVEQPPAEPQPASAKPDLEATVVLDAETIARNINKDAGRRS